MQFDAQEAVKIIAENMAAGFERLKQSTKTLVDEAVKEAMETAMVKAIAAIEVKDGAPGEDGRDGLDIEIMPSIDFDKSYPRGTYAMHKGGLWKSYQKTDGDKGWDCIVCGIETVDICRNPVNPREVKIDIETSTGKQKKLFYIPMPIYKGVFDANHDYEPGDMVTFGGCLYHFNGNKSMPDGVSGRPGENKDWTLAAKKGRDGKDYVSLAGKKNG